jgi:hypothetical protein
MDRRASTRETDSRLFEALGRIEANQEHIKACFDEMKPIVDKHEKIYTVGKYVMFPALAAFHVTFRKLLEGMKW